MKKSGFVVLIAILAAIAGALVAVAVYLNRREKELEEYEQLLFSEDFTDDEMPLDSADDAYFQADLAPEV